jgi:hypothetical protein
MARLLMRLLGILCLATAAPASAGTSQVNPSAEPTDADLVTAIDVSGSIDGYAEWLELAGIADALEHPAVLQAIRDGFYGRIGFLAFTWSSHGDFVELVPWTAIGSSADARRVADRLLAARSVPRLGYSASSNSPHRPWRRNLATDISAALEHALQAVETTPFLPSAS